MIRNGKQHTANRIARALGRVAEANTRTPTEQLALLDTRLGNGIGAARERARLGTLVAEGLDFPPAQRAELKKNKKKKEKKEASDEASRSTTEENRSEDGPSENPAASGGGKSC